MIPDFPTSPDHGQALVQLIPSVVILGWFADAAKSRDCICIIQGWTMMLLDGYMGLEKARV